MRLVHIFLLLIFIFGAGVGVRRYVFHLQQGSYPEKELPFTLESALEYRLTRILYETGSLPAHDSLVEAPEGINRRETYTVGAEYVYAALARALPESWSLTFRVRWISLLWFCVGLVAMACWVRQLSGSWIGGGAAGFLYAVGAAAVVRSTGQELSHENFALPLLLIHLACWAWSRRTAGWRSCLATALSAVFLAGAAATWDMIQFYLYLWMLGYAAASVRGGLYSDKPEFLRWLLHVSVLAAAGAWVPYMRAHDFLTSPLMWLAVAVALAGLPLCARIVGTRGKWIRLALLLLIPGVAWWWMGNGYEEAYGHFGELLAAKISFLNRKPADPALLTFSQRILWTPALNSATWRLTLALFPATLPLSLAAAFSLIHCPRACRKSEAIHLVFWFGTSLIAYVLFVRFHVFVAVFSSALIGCWLSASRRRGGLTRWMVMAVVCAGVALETTATLRHAGRWGRSGVEYLELDELLGWLAGGEADRRVVLANFGVSASVAAYAGCPIVLHPKFETKEARSRVEQYGECLFKGNEKTFRDWANQFGVEYYIHSRGEFSSQSPERQMRYFVNALNPPQDAAARFFEFEPDKLHWFHPVWKNRKYRVFRMVTERDEQRSLELGQQAYEWLCSGRLSQAEKCATEALKLFLDNEQAQQVLLHVASLKEQNVHFQPDE